jgi:hypothetical protein
MTGGMTPTPRYGLVMTKRNNSNEVLLFGGINES